MSGRTEVERFATRAETVAQLSAAVCDCRACPRLVAWREQVARERRRAYADQEYWGRPVPGFGSDRPSIMIVGLAPSAHGANRTGRTFTGDRSGDVLFRALHAVGLATSPVSVSRDDGTALIGVRMAAAVRCAPPANRPTVEERDRCLPWLRRELELVWPDVRSIVVLGAFGWQSLWPVLVTLGVVEANAVLPRFGHGVSVPLTADRRVFGCYHVSPQNVNTGRLTPIMLQELLITARDWAAAHRG